MLRDDILRFIETDLRPSSGRVAPDDHLIDGGILDSISLMRLMQFIETRTGVRIPDNMVTPDNFQTVTAMEKLIAELQA